MPQPTPPQSQAPSPDLSGSEDEDLEFFNHFDSLKANFQYAEECLDDEEDDEVNELMELGEKDLMDKMVELLLEDDDSDNPDWLPEKLKKKAERRKVKNAKR